MTTTPLGKAVTTTEGVATIVLGACVATFSALNHSALPPKYASIVDGGLTVALMLQRGVLKLGAIKQLGVDPVGYLEGELVKEAEASGDGTPTQPGA